MLSVGVRPAGPLLTKIFSKEVFDTNIKKLAYQILKALSPISHIMVFIFIFIFNIFNIATYKWKSSNCWKHSKIILLHKETNSSFSPTTNP